jgi:hypothetical protein
VPLPRDFLYAGMDVKVDKDKFDSLLGRLLKQAPEKTQAIKGSPTPKPREPIIPKPRPSEPR